ncbi:uncharacterized protein LOC107046306 [Diachasma alloeum]|uniref:uncharacterized protein LOC107042021 n=1 Tax=Diachasma alloeum TaxID=454923 RepID=UPI000738350A|nr:uncharacterized protein LOC107042021 [Diachasma alloeum]XP_015124384.1 uncharacterized protein LOC107046306 [Diachasma alloeum]
MENGIKIDPTGLLYEHYHYTKKKLRKKNLLQQVAPRRNAPVAAPEVPVGATEGKEWLNAHTSPEDRVKFNWEISRPARHELLETGCSVHDYYQDLPCLKIQLGVELLLSDFDHLYPNRQNEFFDKWETVRNRVLEELKKCKSIPEADRVLLSAEDLLQHNLDTLILYLLPALLSNPPAKRRRDQAVPKISFREKQDSFILHVETPDNIQPAIERQLGILRAANLTLQPLPVIVGPLANVESIYVYINDTVGNPTIYTVDSILHAIDVTLKIFFALKCSYPVRSSCVWMFLQKAFYDIHRPKDKFSRETLVLIGKISSWLTRNNENEAPNNL